MIASTSLPLVDAQAARPSTQIVKTNNFGINQLPPFAPGVILVSLKQGITAGMGVRGVETTSLSLNKVLAQFGVRGIEPVFRIVRRSPLIVNATGTGVDLSRIYRLRFSPDVNVLQIVQELRKHPAIEYAELDHLAHIIATPNDPEYPNQWGLAKINAPAAWDVVTGTTDMVIAVVDAGTDTTHPDLSGQLWRNPGEIAGNGIDDDNNGYVDDIHGWNFVNNNADLSDNTGHGTEVAGVIAAATDNGTGIAGVCWQCRLMVLKVVQPGGVANYSDIAAGVVYAAQKGAKVINISLGGNSDSITLKTAIASAAQTAVVVAGAGNDNSSAPFYPAAYDDYVLAVAGTNQTDAKVSTSNYGMWVDVCAPGENIRTTFMGGGYGNASGTSLAAAFVSGLAGLLRSQNPTWSANLTRAQIVNTTDNIDGANPGYEGKLGSGRINAQKAVTIAATPLFRYVSYAANELMNASLKGGATNAIAVTLRNDWKDASSVNATLSTTSTDVSVTKGDASYGAIASGQSISNNWDAFQVSVPAGRYGLTIPFTLNVVADGSISSFNFTVATEPQTMTVAGMLTSDTVWTNNRIYIITNDVGVSNGVTLTIQPGTTVKFYPTKRLLVWGTLIADGTPAQPIRFTSNATNPAPGDWDRIYFDGSSVDAGFDSAGNYVGGSILRYAIIEYGNDVYLDDAAPFISHNFFSKMGSTCCGLGGGSNNDANARPTISDNTLVGTGIQLHWNVGSFTILRNTLIGASIYVEKQGSIIGNVVSNAPSGVGIYGGGGQVDLINNQVINCSEGIVVNTNGAITGNLVANNSSNGLRVLGSPTIISNTILSNGGAAFVADSGGPPSVHNNNLIANVGQYAFRNNTTKSISAIDNWWGTTNTAAIESAIYDGFDQVGYGIVSYNPYLLSPEASAPAFVQSIELTPSSPVGIQSVTFDITFSGLMNQSVNPSVTFGATLPYTSYSVLNNAQWLSATQWRATYDITSLVPRGTYTISVSGARGADGMEIPTDTRFSFVVDYAGQITDQTPPNTPLVIAGGKQGDPSTVEAMWWASDPDSSLTGYRYAIGSAPGATDIVNWTMTSNNSFTRSGLGLVGGRQYWIAVQARNIGGLWSASGYSAFVAGQPLRRVFLPLILKGR